MVASQRSQDSSDTMQVQRLIHKSEMEDTTTRECYGSNSSAFVTCQQTHVIYDTCKIYDTHKIHDTHKSSATETNMNFL